MLWDRNLAGRAGRRSGNQAQLAAQRSETKAEDQARAWPQEQNETATLLLVLVAALAAAMLLAKSCSTSPLVSERPAWPPVGHLSHFLHAQIIRLCTLTGRAVQ